MTVQREIDLSYYANLLNKQTDGIETKADIDLWFIQQGIDPNHLGRQLVEQARDSVLEEMEDSPEKLLAAVGNLDVTRGAISARATAVTFGLMLGILIGRDLEAAGNG